MYLNSSYLFYVYLHSVVYKIQFCMLQSYKVLFSSIVWTQKRVILCGNIGVVIMVIVGYIYDPKVLGSTPGTASFFMTFLIS